MTLREALQDIYDRRGILTARIVVEEAHADTNVGKYLHDRFEWDDAVAAEQHRLTQASEMIRSQMVIYRPATEREQARRGRAYVSLPDGDGRAYKQVGEVVEDEFLSRLALQEMEREWKALYRKYSSFGEFIEMVRGDLEGKQDVA